MTGALVLGTDLSRVAKIGGVEKIEAAAQTLTLFCATAAQAAPESSYIGLICKVLPAWLCQLGSEKITSPN